MSPLQKLRELFHGMMNWDGEDLIPLDFVMACYLTPFLPGSVDKAWGDLRGPAAIGKSEILHALKDGQQRSIVLHNITTNAFSSAMQDENDKTLDFSLAYQLSDGRKPEGPKVLVLPELSSFLCMATEKVQKFFSDLRGAFEGEHNTASGNQGLINKSDLNFGLLTACTEKADEYSRANQPLGERTLICRLGKGMEEYEARAALADHVGKTDRVKKARAQNIIRATTRSAIDSAVQHVNETGGKVEQSEDMIRKVGRLGAVSTSVRTMPISGTSLATLSEGPARIELQLMALGDCRVLFDGRSSWTEDDYNLVRRVTQDTMLPECLAAMNVIWRGDIGKAVLPMTVEDIRRGCNQPSGFYRQLKQWAIIGILEPHGEAGYSMHPAFARDVEYTGFLEGL